jgi:hypothetical protein
MNDPVVKDLNSWINRSSGQHKRRISEGTESARRILSFVAVDFDTGEISRHFPNGRVSRDVGTSDGNGYLVLSYKGKQERAHRVVWIEANGQIPKGFVIDHINGIKSDNRLCNLRLVTPSENNQNNNKPQTNGSSGVRGVSWNKFRNKWKASIKHDGKHRHIGLFTSIEDAKNAYIAEAIKHHKNHPYKLSHEKDEL